MRKDNLAPSLEEFGLSKYEARAYLALLKKGHLSVSELAYYANLPRTKAYTTLARLVKKGLAVITQNKPVICSAISPEDAFSELVATQENSVKEMKSIIETLQKINMEGRPQGAEERRYLVLDPSSVVVMVEQMVSAARSKIALTLDSWGLRLIAQCKDSLVKAVTSNVEVKILVSTECASNDILSSLPNGTNIRVGEPSVCILVFDKSAVIMLDGNNGKGTLFRSPDTMGNICSRIFDDAWNKGKDLVRARFAQRTVS